MLFVYNFAGKESDDYDWLLLELLRIDLFNI